MHRSGKQHRVLEMIRESGGLLPENSRLVSERSAVPEAEVYGAASFYHLLSSPHIKLRVCTGLSCRLRGADELLSAARAAQFPVEECSCLAACDVPPALLVERVVRPAVEAAEVMGAPTWEALRLPELSAASAWRGPVGPDPGDPDRLALHLAGAPTYHARSFEQARARGAAAVLEEIEQSGLQGRGGAGFPAHIKWRAVHGMAETTRYVVLNADEGEPGTFKDREVMVRRPDLVLEGLAIAADAVGAKEIYLYLRGEFELPRLVMEDAIARFADRFGDLRFVMHSGDGAYICGEETAMLEALEGKRGMPRLKPPYPVEKGLWGKPTLVHNVETIACVPAIVRRGGEWFRDLGRTEAGSKLYCVSGHVKRPGTYELPLGVTLDELAEAAGGLDGELLAFSPGGASSGFLPASYRTLPLDYANLGRVGSMLGSAGLVVLNTSADLAEAVSDQLRFFERESCGQCAPCRIGTRYLAEAIQKSGSAGAGEVSGNLQHAAEVAWEMREGSICGLGQAAALPLTSVLEHFPEVFSHRQSET